MISEPKEPSAQEEDLHNLAETLDSARIQFALAERMAACYRDHHHYYHPVNAELLVMLQRLADLLDKEAASLLEKDGAMSRNLKYYDEERRAFPYAWEQKPRAVLELAFRKLMREYDLGTSVELRWTSGGRVSKAFRGYAVVLNADWSGVGVVIHEVAHILHARNGRDHRGELAHGHHHWRIMRGMMLEARASGWFDGALEQELARKEERVRVVGFDRAWRKALREWLRDPRAEKIEIRRAQVLRLERKIKALSTRLSTAKRSLAGFERASKQAARTKDPS